MSISGSADHSFSVDRSGSIRSRGLVLLRVPKIWVRVLFSGMGRWGRGHFGVHPKSETGD